MPQWVSRMAQPPPVQMASMMRCTDLTSVPADHPFLFADQLRLAEDPSPVRLPARLVEPALVRHYESVMSEGMRP